MKKLFILFVSLGSSFALADSVVCTAGGYPGGTPVPCSASPLQITAQFPGESFSGNTLTVFPNLNVQTGAAPLPNASVTATITANDNLSLPASPAGDVYQVTAIYNSGTSGGNEGTAATFTAQIGPGSSTYPEILLDAAGPCPPGGCQFTGTIPAAAFSFLAIQASAELVANNNSPVDSGVSSGGLFTFTRFKADGVTPDPFTTTPEPASFALAGFGALAIAGFAIGRRLVWSAGTVPKAALVRSR